MYVESERPVELSEPRPSSLWQRQPKWEHACRGLLAHEVTVKWALKNSN